MDFHNRNFDYRFPRTTDSNLKVLSFSEYRSLEYPDSAIEISIADFPRTAGILFSEYRLRWNIRVLQSKFQLQISLHSTRFCNQSFDYRFPSTANYRFPCTADSAIGILIQDFPAQQIQRCQKNIDNRFSFRISKYFHFQNIDYGISGQYFDSRFPCTADSEMSEKHR